MNNQVKIVLSQSDVNRLNAAIRKFGHDVEKSKKAEKMFDEALRKAASPWQRIFKGGKMYERLQRITGGFDDPMGNTKIKGRRVGIHGRRVGPKLKGKSAGWRAHFFASPARHIKKSKQVPFARIFRSQNGKVRSILKVEIENLLQKLASDNF